MRKTKDKITEINDHMKDGIQALPKSYTNIYMKFLNESKISEYTLNDRKFDFREALDEFIEENHAPFPPNIVKAFFNWYTKTEPNGRMRFELCKNFDFRSKLDKWYEKALTFNQNRLNKTISVIDDEEDEVNPIVNPKKIDYKVQLKNPKWQKLAAESKIRDNWTCQCCGDTETHLHTHHLRYPEYGKSPWEVSSDDLITYCEDCHSCLETVISIREDKEGKDRLRSAYLKACRINDGDTIIMTATSRYSGFSNIWVFTKSNDKYVFRIAVSNEELTSVINLIGALKSVNQLN